MSKYRPSEDAAAMKIARRVAYAPRTRAAAERVAQLNEPCIGCTGCKGVCKELVEVLTLPDVVTKKERR